MSGMRVIRMKILWRLSFGRTVVCCGPLWAMRDLEADWACGDTMREAFSKMHERLLQ